jgi:hypothetical protein
VRLRGPRLTSHRAAWLAWSLWAVFVALQLAIGWLVAFQDGTPDELFSLVTVVFATVGALVASRRPDNAVGWVLLTVGLAFAVQACGEVYVAQPDHPAVGAVGWLSAVAWPVWIVLAAVYLPLLFPTGRLLSPRWRPVAWLAGLALGLGVVSIAFAPGDLDLSAPVRNPLAASGAVADVMAAIQPVSLALAALTAFLAVGSLVLRFRRSRGVERQQLKWFASAVVFTFAALTLSLVAVAFPGGWRDVIGDVGWYTFLIACLFLVPLSVGVAVLRHRLYDIDLVIKRTLVYGSLTALLAAAYLGLVLLLRLALGPVTEGSDLAVAASTLAVAALFRPLRSRIQSTVDRRFYRRRYDAAQTLQGFAGRLRDELDLDALGTDLRAVVHQTMQPAHVSLWLREAAR